MWMRQLMQSARTSVGRAVDWGASTPAVLLVMGTALAVLAITTLTNPMLDTLPGQKLIAMVSGAGAGAAVVAAVFGPTRMARRLIGAAMMVCAGMRAAAFAVRNAQEVDTIGDWLARANPVAVNLLAWYLGFLVWARATQPVHIQSREVGGEQAETTADAERSGGGRPRGSRIVRGLRVGGHLRSKRVLGRVGDLPVHGDRRRGGVRRDAAEVRG